MIVKAILSLLVLVGLWGSGKLSYQQYLSGEACPILGDAVPACYIAFVGYILITAGVVVSLLSGSQVGGYFFLERNRYRRRLGSTRFGFGVGQRRRMSNCLWLSSDVLYLACAQRCDRTSFPSLDGRYSALATSLPLPIALL